MASSNQGSFEVDQTLRLARDSIERDVARYRIVVFASATILTSTLHLIGLSDTWAPAFVLGGAAVYAVLVLLYLQRYGNPPALAYIAHVLDLCSTVVNFE